MTFVFEQSTKCKQHLVREFYAKWDLRDPDHKVKICGQVFTFTTKDLNELLDILEADAELLR